MGRQFEGVNEAELAATPEQVWQAWLNRVFAS